MTTPIYRIVTMYRIASKNTITGDTERGDFSMTLKEAEASIESLKKDDGTLVHWIESEECKIPFKWFS